MTTLRRLALELILCPDPDAKAARVRALRLDAFEVAEVFEVPLAFLMDPANHRRHAVQFQEVSRRFLSMPWRRDVSGDEYFIWGATAAMLRNLYRFLSH